MKLTEIDKAINELKNGKTVILTDHSDGVKGCFVIAAGKTEAEVINQMIFYGRSPIQLALFCPSTE